MANTLENPVYLLKKELEVKDYAGMQKVFREHGTDTKHFGLIKQFEVPKADVKKNLGTIPMDFVGVNIRKVRETGEVKMIGFYNGGYKCYENKGASYIVETFTRYLRACYNHQEKGKNYNLAFWGDDDGKLIHRLLLENNGYNKEEVEKSTSRVGYVQGEFSKGAWVVEPIARTDVAEYKEVGRERVVKRLLEVGISKIVKDTYLFYFLPFEFNDAGEKVYLAKKPLTVWGYNIADLYGGTLCENGKKQGYLFTELNSQYKDNINWERYEKERSYKEKVVLANKTDAYLTKMLAYGITEDLQQLFGTPIKSVVSTGSLAKYVLSTELSTEEYNSIGYLACMKNWETQGISQETMLKASNLFLESYSAGLIEVLALGYAKKGAMADLTGAYASVLRTLPRFDNSTIELVEEYPREVARNEFYFIRCVVDVPSGTEHTLTIKTPRGKTKQFAGENEERGTIKNARPTGIFMTTAVYEEIEYAKKKGVEVLEVVEIVKVTTTDEHSPFKKVVEKLFNLRMKLKAEGKSDLSVKQAMAAMYGKTFETHRLYEEDKDGAHFVGHSAAEIFNPIIASLVTAYTRLILQHTTELLKKNGAKVLTQMTDAIYWTFEDETILNLEDMAGRELTTGDLARMLPTDIIVDVLKDTDKLCAYTGVRAEKTLGYFSEVEEFTDLYTLGIGRYEMKDKEGNIITKALGINTVNQDQSKGDIVGTWEEAFKTIRLEVNPYNGKEYEVLGVKHNVLINAGYVNAYKKALIKGEITETEVYKLFGATIEEEQLVDVLRVMPKRALAERTPRITELTKRIIKTDPVSIAGNLGIFVGLLDGTLPFLRERTEERFKEVGKFTPFIEKKSTKKKTTKPKMTQAEERQMLADKFGVSVRTIRKVKETRARECKTQEEFDALLKRVEEEIQNSKG